MASHINNAFLKSVIYLFKKMTDNNDMLLNYCNLNKFPSKTTFMKMKAKLWWNASRCYLDGIGDYYALSSKN